MRRLLPRGGSLPLIDWQLRHRRIVALLWSSILAVAAYAVATQPATLLREVPALASVLACGLLSGPRVASRQWRSVAASLGLLICAAALVDVSGGLIEMHFAFFVVVVVLTLYEDWIPFLLAVAFVLLHHGIMGSVDPQAVFNRSQEWTNPWPWAALHAVFIAMAGAAGVTAWRLNEQVRDRMRSAQAELARILDAAGNAVYGLDREGRVTFANPEALRMTGHRADELIGQTLHALVHHTRADGTAYPFADCPTSKALAQGIVQSGDGEVYWRADGTSFPVDVSCTPIVEDGRVTGAVVVAKDISERREAERAREELTSILERQGAQLNEAQALAQLGSWEWDGVTGVLESSAELCRIFGLEPGQPPTGIEPYFELVHPDDRPAVEATLAAARTRGEAFTFECRIVRPDGKVRVVHAVGEVRSGGEPPLRILGTAQDITERRMMEAETRQNSRFVELSRDLVCAIGFDGRLEQFNAAWAHTLGWTEDELRSRRLVDLVHPGDRDRMERATARLVAGKQTADFLTRCATRAGGWRWLEWNAIGAVEESLIYASGRDVTDRQAAEVELADAHRVALEASRLKSEFLANMSHEIRTPLNGVIGMGELLLDTALDEEQREYVDAVGASGEALMSVVNDILDFSKIEAGKLELDQHGFELCGVVDDVWSMLATTAHDKNLELIAWVEADLPAAVYGDSARVRQVLTNFATNAIKFTAAGDVVLRVTAAPLAGSPSGGVRFAVTDTGIGVEPEALGRIFDAFSQADSSTTRRYGGTGLGLAICRQLVDLMGGRIGVDSEPGVGSTFWFTVPLIPMPADASVRERPDFGAARVLIVDGYLTSRVILDHRLSAWNLACDAAADADGALGLLDRAALAGNPYALAIIDVRAAAADGFALARAIRARPAGRSTRLLMLASAGSMREAATQAGLEGFLTKPVGQLRLAREIERLLDSGARPPRGEQASSARRSARAPVDHGRRVLLAEDNMVNQLVAVRMLERRGFRVDVAVDGHEAVRRNEAGPYDLIFMDCQMPELDGYAATAEIRRAEASGGHTQIIAMTANTLEGDRERCLAAGMDDYVAKPLSANDLETVIARALARTPAITASGGA